MKYLPYENVTFTTKLSKEDVLNRIKEQLETEKYIRKSFWGFEEKTKPYEGIISENTFAIKRILNYRNSFQPRINGIIEENSNGSKVRVKMYLYFPVTLFLLTCCLFLICMVVKIFNLSHIYKFHYQVLGSLFPLIILVPIYGLAIGAFKYESNKSITFLQSLFEAEIEKS